MRNEWRTKKITHAKNTNFFRQKLIILAFSTHGLCFSLQLSSHSRASLSFLLFRDCYRCRTWSILYCISFSWLSSYYTWIYCRTVYFVYCVCFTCVLQSIFSFYRLSLSHSKNILETCTELSTETKFNSQQCDILRETPSNVHENTSRIRYK